MPAVADLQCCAHYKPNEAFCGFAGALVLLHKAASSSSMVHATCWGDHGSAGATHDKPGVCALTNAHGVQQLHGLRGLASCMALAAAQKNSACNSSNTSYGLDGWGSVSVAALNASC